MKAENLITWDHLSLDQEIFCLKCGQFSGQIKILSPYEVEPVIIRCHCGAEESVYRCNTPGCNSYVLGGEGYGVCRYCSELS
jgi:hypothetical protein